MLAPAALVLFRKGEDDVLSGSRKERERVRSGAREGVWLRWELVDVLLLLLAVFILVEVEGGLRLREAAEALPEGGPEKRNGGGAREGCGVEGESVAILFCGRRDVEQERFWWYNYCLICEPESAGALSYLRLTKLALLR